MHLICVVLDSLIVNGSAQKRRKLTLPALDYIILYALAIFLRKMEY